MHVLHTGFYTLSVELTMRICLTVKCLFGERALAFFFTPNIVIQQWYCKEKLDASYS